MSCDVRSEHVLIGVSCHVMVRSEHVLIGVSCHYCFETQTTTQRETDGEAFKRLHSLSICHLLEKKMRDLPTTFLIYFCYYYSNIKCCIDET